MDPNRRSWNDQHKLLKQALKSADHRISAVDLFLVQHAMVHSGKLSKLDIFSFEDEIFTNLSLESCRMVPAGTNHSIAWLIWHLARVEDVTMALLVGDAQQTLHKSNWNDRLGVGLLHTGNGMSDREVLEFSEAIDVYYLREYRLAVARETRKIVKKLRQADFKAKVDSSRLQRIRDERAMLPNARGIVDYWGKRTIGGILLMPPTRHCFLHLNEARRIRSKLRGLVN